MSLDRAAKVVRDLSIHGTITSGIDATGRHVQPISQTYTCVLNMLTYGMTCAPDHHSVSVAAAVIDDAGRVLVIQRRDNGRWEAPGGVLEMDESIPEGVAREVLEETGLEHRADEAHGRLQEHGSWRCRHHVPSQSNRGNAPYFGRVKLRRVVASRRRCSTYGPSLRSSGIGCPKRKRRSRGTNARWRAPHSQRIDAAKSCVAYAAAAIDNANQTGSGVVAAN